MSMNLEFPIRICQLRSIILRISWEVSIVSKASSDAYTTLIASWLSMNIEHCVRSASEESRWAAMSEAINFCEVAANTPISAPNDDNNSHFLVRSSPLAAK